MPRRKLLLTDNKYSRGVVAICAGSKKYPGAALLAVGGARSGGAGYVKFLSKSRELALLVVSEYPDVVPITSLNDERFDSLLIGPGASSLTQIPIVPLVLDSAAIASVTRKSFKNSNRTTVITPHEGELKYLGGRYKNLLEVSDRIEVAKEISREFEVFVVLKGQATVIAAPDGRISIDQFGGPELATAGSGDLLAGLIASMLVRIKDGVDPFDLVCVAVELHSKAGRYASKKFTSVTALEILEALHHV